MTLSALLAATGGVALAEPDSWANTNEDEIRALVAEMVADSDSRSSLLQSGGTAGHDGKFFLQSADGSFRLNVSGQVQFRYIANFRDDEDDTDDFESGFTTNRTSLRFDGKIYDEFIFGVEGNFDRDGGDFELEDAFVGYTFENGLLLLWGQYREPILWEDVINDKASLAVDQSVVNAVFRQDRSQGVWLHYTDEDWRMWAGVNDGIRAENTDFDQGNSDFGFTTRWEWKFAGEWSQFDQFTSPKGSELGSKLGGGFHYELGADRPTPPGDGTDLAAFTADLMFTGDGWSLYAAGVGLWQDPDGGSETTDYGFVAQGSYYFSDPFEMFARYDVVIADDDRANDDAFNTITAGFNYYMHGQAAKFTFDVVYYPDETTSNDLVDSITGPGAERGRRIGLLESGNEDQFALRAQFQLLF